RVSAFCYIARRRPARSSLFPYTTLFRSHRSGFERAEKTTRKTIGFRAAAYRQRAAYGPAGHGRGKQYRLYDDDGKKHSGFEQDRSEEHTSELQSRENLVCRLLLEKKKIN